MPTPVTFNLFAPEFRANPYPVYAELRAREPMHWGMSYEAGQVGKGEMWHVARYADILAILKDPRFTHGLPVEAEHAPVEMTDAALFHMLAAQSLLFIDPPAHGRLRGLVSKAFTPRMIEELRPRIQAVADGLLDNAAAQGGLDIVNDYAVPLTTTIIAEMLGVPVADQAQLRQWSGVLVKAIDCKATTEIYATASQVAWEVVSFFQGVIAAKRTQPSADIISGLIQAHEQEDRLSEQELIVTATTLLIAGHETTVNLIGNGMLALLQHPDQLRRLRDQPDHITSAIEEFLRYDAPSQMASRVATKDIPIGGVTVQRGQTVNLLLGSGNRDPEAFPDPDRLDIARADNRQLAFGMGMHYCLGAPLARLEGQIAIGSLLRRFPALQLVDLEPVWRDTIGFRGLQRLPVTLA